MESTIEKMMIKMNYTINYLLKVNFDIIIIKKRNCSQEMNVSLKINQFFA